MTFGECLVELVARACSSEVTMRCTTPASSNTTRLRYAVDTASRWSRATISAIVSGASAAVSTSISASRLRV